MGIRRIDKVWLEGVNLVALCEVSILEFVKKVVFLDKAT